MTLAEAFHGTAVVVGIFSCVLISIVNNDSGLEELEYLELQILST